MNSWRVARLRARRQPVEDVAAEDVEDHVEVVEETTRRPCSFVIPAPNLIGCVASNSVASSRVRALGPSITRGAILRQHRCMVAGEQR